MKRTKLAVIVSSLILFGCTTTNVIKDNSGSKIVDLLHAHYAEEVLQAVNRLADSEDRNTVNVITPYNQNQVPVQQSYSGKVVETKKIVIPDTYPQKQWRDNQAVATKTVKSNDYKNQSADDSLLTPQARVEVKAQGHNLTTQNAKLISDNKLLRDDMKVTQNTARLAKTQAEKEVEVARLKSLKEIQKVEKALDQEVSKAQAKASSQIKAIEDSASSSKIEIREISSEVVENPTPELLQQAKERNAVVIQ